MTTTFKPMLAGTLTEKDFDKLQFPLFASPKIDGIRCIIRPDSGAVSRTLKPIPNDFIREALSIPELNGLDGELVFADDPTDFLKTVSSVMTKAGEPHMTFVVFDYVPEDPQGATYGDRYGEIEDIIEEAAKSGKLGKVCIRRLAVFEIANLEQLLAYEEEVLAQGFEGVMLRYPDRDYKFGRSSVNPNQQHLLKLKRFEDAEAVVIGMEELMHNDNEAVINELGHTERSSHMENKRGGQTLGKLLVRGTNGKFKDVEFQVGGGFTAAQRQEIWAKGTAYWGKTITYKFFDVATKDKPRHPVFKSFREGF